MRRDGVAAVVSLVVVVSGVVGCSSADPDPGERVSVEELIDLSSTLPDDAAGIDLGEVTPAEQTFCEAWSTSPLRWFDDAVFPVQYVVDSFGAAADVPPEAADSLERLLEFGEHKLDWNFKRREDRPVWDAAMAEHTVIVTDAALATCADLPLVIQPADSRPGSPLGGSCDSDLAGVQAGIDWYLQEFGELPVHQQQIERAADLAYHRTLEETGEVDIEMYYVSSDVHGVSPDGSGEVVPVPGGACEQP